MGDITFSWLGLANGVPELRDFTFSSLLWANGLLEFGTFMCRMTSSQLGMKNCVLDLGDFMGNLESLWLQDCRLRWAKSVLKVGTIIGATSSKIGVESSVNCLVGAFTSPKPGCRCLL